MVATHKKKSLSCGSKDTKPKKRVNAMKLASKVRLFHPLKNRFVKVEDLKIATPKSFKSVAVESTPKPSRDIGSVNVTPDEVLRWLKACKVNFRMYSKQMYVIENNYYSFSQILILANRLRIERGLPVFEVL